MKMIARKSGRWTPLGIAAVVLGFYVWWPIGLAAIAYILWGGSIDDLVYEAIGEVKKLVAGGDRARPVSGNAAFDAYRAETLKRLEEEQAEFNNYVRKLREARDSEEFELFMKERKVSIDK